MRRKLPRPLFAPEQSPRERLLRHGAAALSETELVALLLGTGACGTSVLDLAQSLLSCCGGLSGLATAPVATLRLSGLGPAKRSTVLAAVEVGRRLAREEIPPGDLLDRPALVARYLGLRYCVAGQEVMGALYVDSRNRLVHEDEVFRGTLSRTSVEPRALLRIGLAHDASGLVLFHTHPSGDPSPSAEDLAFTRRLDSACEVIGLRLVDHVILGHGGRWLSLRERGGW